MVHWSIEHYKDYLKKAGSPSKIKTKCKYKRNNQISNAELNYETIYIKPRVRSGRIKSYEAQKVFELWPKTKTERQIIFKPDFVINYSDGRQVVVELKGKEIKKLQRDYHLRKRRFKELYPQYEYKEIKSEEWSKSD